MNDNGNLVLQMKNISKEFPGVKALNGVNFELQKGEICGLLGENGAGKSTLMKILGGIYPLDSGEIWIDGKKVSIKSPYQAREQGIAFVHQELSQFDELDIATNIFVQDLPAKKGYINSKKLYDDTKTLLKKVKLEHCNPHQPIKELKIGEQQLVEIARCLSMNAKIIVLDEPTSSLTSRETRILFDLMKELRENGVSIIFITHRLDEIFEVCNKITILRDGQLILSTPIEEISREQIVENMIGRSMSDMYKKRKFEVGEELIRVEGFCRDNKFEDISFSVKSREVVGLYGLLGSGRSEIVRAIFGLDKFRKGDVYIRGNKVVIRNPEDAIKNGIGFVPENRREEGLTLEYSVLDNLTLASLKNFTKNGIFMQRKEEIKVAEQNVKDLSIKTPSLKRLIKYLSGGNQQKVVISKWINTSPSVLILDEPTRGIDVGAKSEIYDTIEDLVETGMGVFIISSELNEVIELCDRVLVIKSGKIINEFAGKDITKENLLASAMGV